MSLSLVSRSVANIPFTLPASDGETLYCDARFSEDASAPLPVLIFVHGFKGFKDWGWGPHIGESMARRGFYALAFNFSHNGVEGNGSEFTRLDRFARNTFSREVRELREVVDAIAEKRVPRPELIDTNRIAIVGHSRGGGITLLESSRDERVKAVAVWASVSDFDRYTERQKQQWRKAGYFESKNMRTGQMMRLDVGLLDDLEAHDEALDIGRAAASLGRPLLILHGEQDLSVRVEEGEHLASVADPELTEFERIPRTAHTLGTAHPFQATTPELEYAIERTASFLLKHLERS
jgi:dipeptidyl aminopeptidase/acylaminoacyl peptidase